MIAKITKPHDYQEDSINETFLKWSQGVKNICLVAPTGAGKTIIKAFAAKRFLEENPDKYVVIFAHRDVLLTQISLAAAMVGLPHKMLCAKPTELAISNQHVEELGHSYMHRDARLIIASVPTWIKRDTTSMSAHVGMWAMDEFHHTLRSNMWGKAVLELAHAKGLGVTATPLRADGKGLGSHASGVAEEIIKTPGMDELIRRGRLSNYKVYIPPNRVNTANINITSSGDYNQIKLAAETDRADITGDAVDHYLRLAKGKQGIVFAAGIQHAEHVAEEFRARGVNAVALSSKTKLAIRQRKIREFRQGKIDLLVNYDLFGEGFDVPSVSVVIMLRKTKSYSLFKQMFGRCLRVLDGKPYGILIDHVGNVEEHRLPGKHLHEDPEWSLDDERKRPRNSDLDEEEIISRICPKCMHYYLPLKNHINHFICPDCGHKESDTEREETQRKLQIAEGTLIELDTGYFAEIQKEIAKVNKPVEQVEKYMSKAPTVIRNSAVKRHRERLEAQDVLRKWIINWCNETGFRMGLDVKTTQDEFTRVFSINVFQAQILGASKADELRERIQNDLLFRRLFK